MANKDYLNYLVDKVKAYDEVSICEELHSIKFYYDPSIMHDGITAENCKKLRVSYSQETGRAPETTGDATVLEFLIYIAIRMDDIMGIPGEEHPDRWFFEMTDNLGLYSGDVRENVSRWMNRDFRKNGSGGLFPLKKPGRDQRAVPFWEQAGSYMGERI